MNRCAACNAMQRNATRCFQAQLYYGDPAVEFTVIVKIPKMSSRVSVSQRDANATRRDAFQAQLYYEISAVEFTVIVKIPNRLPEYPRSSVSQTRRNATRCDAMRIEFRKFLSTSEKSSSEPILRISISPSRQKASGHNPIRRNSRRGSWEFLWHSTPRWNRSPLVIPYTSRSPARVARRWRDRG